MFKVAINGYGRIGRMVLRALYERNKHNLKIVAINEISETASIAHLTRYDSSHGPSNLNVSYTKNELIVNGDTIELSHESSPEKLNWKNKNIDLILECSGSFSDKPIAEKYLQHAPKLLLSHPGKDDIDATVVYGFNHSILSKSHQFVSCASCTTNCIVPVIYLVSQKFGIESGAITTLHSVMNDQPVIDSYHKSNLRLTRSALQSIIPVGTKLSKGIGRLLPELGNVFQTMAVRVPVTNVSAMDITLNLKKETTKEDVNQLFEDSVASSKFCDILGFSLDVHASIDFNHDQRSCIIDGTQTKIIAKKTLKVFLAIIFVCVPSMIQDL